MNQPWDRKRKRQLQIGLGLVLVLGGLLIASKTADGWDARQWLIGGVIVGWALGPSVIGGFVGAKVFSRRSSATKARRGEREK